MIKTELLMLDIAFPSNMYICKRFRSPGFYSIPPGWESIPGLLKRFTTSGSCYTVVILYICTVSAYASVGKHNKLKGISLTRNKEAKNYPWLTN
jgi:hypothetical protein